ncbi:MAG: hypothetical protein KJ880_00650, partial [Candidatus Omnitrophica bacterium]|nr:hypothetical protein [Candidatus Omnitrophota bacterium]
MRRLLPFILFLLMSGLSVASEPLELDRIVVTPEGDYSLGVVTQGQIERENSLVDALSDSGGVDLRQRGPIGVQQDLSLRGSTYEQ